MPSLISPWRPIVVRTVPTVHDEPGADLVANELSSASLGSLCAGPLVCVRVGLDQAGTRADPRCRVIRTAQAPVKASTPPPPSRNVVEARAAELTACHGR